MKNFITIIFIMTLSLLLLNSTNLVMQHVIAQNNNSSQLIKDLNQTQSNKEKTFVLIFGQRTVGNIDNSTKIVSSVIGHNLMKIEEEFLEEISLAPSQQLEEQINKVINEGIKGANCDTILTTQQGEEVAVTCLTSADTIIWYIYPN